MNKILLRVATLGLALLFATSLPVSAQTASKPAAAKKPQAETQGTKKSAGAKKSGKKSAKKKMAKKSAKKSKKMARGGGSLSRPHHVQEYTATYQGGR